MMDGVVMAHPLPLLAGHAVVMTWYNAMRSALVAKDTNKAVKLFEAALSVPIRLRICTDGDSCYLARLLFAENMFTASAASGAESFWLLAEKVSGLRGFQEAVGANASLPNMLESLFQT